MIRNERAGAQAFGGEIVALTGDEIEARHWDASGSSTKTPAAQMGVALPDARLL